MMVEQRPWVDENGNLVSETELRRATETWGASTWEDFLKTTVEGPQMETLTEALVIESFGDRYREAYQEMLSHKEYPNFQQFVRSLMRRLTCREREVIDAIFWQGLSQHEMAQRLKIKRSAVRNCRDRALRKLGVLFVEKLLFETDAPQGGPIWPKDSTIKTMQGDAS